MLNLHTHSDRATEHKNLVNSLRPIAERYAQADALAEAIKESEVCQNWREETGTECVQPGPLCQNFECGLCEGCRDAGYLCPNADRHDFGKV